MSTMYERAKQELILAGYDLKNKNKEIKSDKDYTDRIGISALEIVKIFCKQGHSGFSAAATIQLITKLLNGETLTPLTNDIEEWHVVSEKDDKRPRLFQSKRKFSCFSEDELKTYYDLDEEPRKYHKLATKGVDNVISKG